ncbi:glycosyltransferase family 4 protein [Ahrensia marina]|uniref:glycosyltransferase family 4 protein n=1 Tax=Ahrensia marina TaxID=1514904 RepID=UPI0035D133F0
MTSVYYISPSILPSRTANSAHVAHQCAGLAMAGAKVTLVTKRGIADPSRLPEAISTAYGISSNSFATLSYFSRSEWGNSLRIAVLALAQLARQARPDLVISRNLYAAYILAVALRWPLVFETHQLEFGLRKLLQCAIMTRPNTLTVVISEQLKSILTDHHSVAPACSIVLHDAAPAGIEPLAPSHRYSELAALVPNLDISEWESVCGYFGHLYAGRGIKIIESMAAARPNVLFLVVGGNNADVAAHRSNTCLENLVYTGFVQHPVALRAMSACDVLLMPYQRNVSIGVANQDTARWMSPMKMFEYLASGTPIISSDLPVLREVLEDGHTALLAPPDVPEAWIGCLDRLLDDPDLAETIGAAGHQAYLTKHTWQLRAEAILAAAKASMAAQKNP